MPSVKDWVNEALLPIRLLIPQPVVAKIPWLMTNEEARIKVVLSYIQPEHTCLDIGCGTNKLIRSHRARGGIGVGVDTFDWQGADLVVPDSSDLPFSAQEFDRITFVASFNHIPNRLEVLKECIRVLKDEGQVILTFLSPAISLTWHKWAFWDSDSHHRGMAEGERYGFTEEEIERNLSVAGLELVSVKRFAWGMNKVAIARKLPPGSET